MTFHISSTMFGGPGTTSFRPLLVCPFGRAGIPLMLWHPIDGQAHRRANPCAGTLVPAPCRLRATPVPGDPSAGPVRKLSVFGRAPSEDSLFSDGPIRTLTIIGRARSKTYCFRMGPPENLLFSDGPPPES